MTEEEFHQKLINVADEYSSLLEPRANDYGWVENHIILVRLQMGGIWDGQVAVRYYRNVKSYFESLK